MLARFEGLVLMLHVPLLLWINSSNLWQSTVKVGLQHKNWFYYACFATDVSEFTISSKCQVTGLTLGDVDDRKPFFTRLFFFWFYCFNSTAKLNLR